MSKHAIEIAIERCSYDRAVVLSNVSLTVLAGTFVGLIGPSGAGKTTILKSVVGLVPQVRGQVIVGGTIGPLPAGHQRSSGTCPRSRPSTGTSRSRSGTSC